MDTVFGTFDTLREKLGMQYVDAFYNEDAYKRIDKFSDEVLCYAESLGDIPHSVIKARCFEYILKNAPLYINGDDIFGVCLEGQKFAKMVSWGCMLEKVIGRLNSKWQKELKDVLNPHEDIEFINNAENYLINEFYIDYNHSTPCWEDIFALGIKGIYGRILVYKERHSPLNEEQQAYFDALEITYRAISGFFERLIDALEYRNEPKLEFMRKALINISHNPPSNTYEALLLGWLYWYLQENIDALRCRTMGGLDELYLKFYTNDIKSGTFTKEEIKEMFIYFMNEFYSFRVGQQQPMYLGGTDMDGKCIVNELSYLILDAYDTLSRPDPKLQIKVGKNTPKEFSKRVLEIIRNGNSSISIINDDNAITSLKKIGVSDKEATTYLMSGCWDYTVKNHEVKTIPARVSLPRILEYTMTNGVCLATGKKVGCETGYDFETFDEFYSAFKSQVMYIWKRTKKIVENWELYLKDINPSNMFSATMTDSLECAQDGYANGMKYNTTVFTLAGLGTLVDSLCVIKKYVYDKKVVSLNEFVNILKLNWRGYEDLRRIIMRDNDKYGNGSKMADEITFDITSYLSYIINKVPNSRGSYWKIGLLSIDKNIRFGELMDATPDGRLKGEPLSKNLSPSVGMDRSGITTLINSVCNIDFTLFPHAGIFDLILHPSAVAGSDGLEAFYGILKTYFDGGGHSIQFNVFSADTLKDAQRNPDKYKNLQVRVCGWNVYFTELEKIAQDIFIAQCEHNESGL